MYILLTGYPPFNGESDDEILFAVENKKLNFYSDVLSNISTSAKKLLQGMIERNVKKRLTAEQVINHQWFRDLNQENINFNQVYLDNIKKFQIKNKLQQLIYFFFVNQTIKPKDHKNLMEIFDSLDKTKDGFISKFEIMKAFTDKSIPLSNLELEELFEKIDNDGNDKINYTEFIGVIIDKNKIIKENRIR